MDGINFKNRQIVHKSMYALSGRLVPMGAFAVSIGSKSLKSSEIVRPGVYSSYSSEREAKSLKVLW